MEYFPRYGSFVRGIHRSPVNSPHKGQWDGALMFSVDLSMTKRLLWIANEIVSLSHIEYVSENDLMKTTR